MRTGNLDPPRFEIVLYQPEIPPNAGNVIRLCANTGCLLHLVQPLGFTLRDRQLRRAGLDYRALAEVALHESWEACRTRLGGKRLYAITTRGERTYSEAAFECGDVFVFGPETAGLPSAVLAEFSLAARLRIPMLQGSRSLNLANAVTLVIYEAWRQLGFRGGV